MSETMQLPDTHMQAGFELHASEFINELQTAGWLTAALQLLQRYFQLRQCPENGDAFTVLWSQKQPGILLHEGPRFGAHEASSGAMLHMPYSHACHWQLALYCLLFNGSGDVSGEKNPAAVSGLPPEADGCGTANSVPVDGFACADA